MLNFDKFFTIKRYNFLSNKDGKKKFIFHWHEIVLRIQWCHKKFNNGKKKNQLFSKFITDFLKT